MANYLFLIGIDDYLHQKKLNSSVKDVRDFKDVLLEKYEFREEDKYELINEGATSKNIQDALRKYVNLLKEEDNLIIFFSGHGEYDSITDIGYWIPHEASDYTGYIPNQIIIKYLESLKCKHIFVISDSCFSNQFLLTGKTKNSNDYFEKNSRWALTSSFVESKDSDEETNTLFCEYIIDFLQNTENDFRVTELIEYVKSQFELNVLQKPQGSPLQIRGHEGGEFIFKVRAPIDNRKFRGYNDFSKILTFFRRNSSFNEVVKFEDRTNKIGYNLYQEIDNVFKKLTYYLYVYEGINQTKTIKHLKENQARIFTDKNLVVFITAERDQKNREARKKNIQEKFKPVNTFYIDEFIKEHCTPKVFNDDDSKYLNITNFISPPFKGDGKEKDIQRLFRSWYEKIEEPILVIKGSGGIGKTTIAQYLADSLILTYPKNYVLFIDSLQIKDSLLKNKNRGKLSVYNFYEALFEITETFNEKLSEELFRINLDAGNLLLIIDGLDEVISKIPHFNINDFISSIKTSSNELGNGKVILTCRTYFWDKADYNDDYFKIIELEPFNEIQAKEFFNISFMNSIKKTNKAIKLANEFKFPNSDNENIFHPYVLDIIRSIIESESDETDLIRSDLSSKFLNKNLKNDFILYRVCEREKIRVGQIDVDKQIEFFINFSVNKRGIIRTSAFKHEIESSISEKIDFSNAEAFKSHPFLKIEDSSVTFRYDFLADLFKGIYMAMFTTSENENVRLTKPFLEILNESCWFGSALNSEIVNRSNKWNEDELLLISDLITQINAEDIPEDLKRKSIANLFNLSLTINGKFKNFSVSANTALLKSIFEIRKNEIQNLNILNINTDQNIRFDFSDLKIENALIDNYNNFWKCNFNENTHFRNCILLNIKVKSPFSTVNKNNFIDCTFDSMLENSLRISESVSENQVESIKLFLSQFFHLFVSNGKLGRQWEDKVIKPRYSGINKININYNKVIKLVKRHNFVIATQELSKTKLAINESQKEQITKFMKDGAVSREILDLIQDLKNT